MSLWRQLISIIKDREKNSFFISLFEGSDI